MTNLNKQITSYIHDLWQMRDIVSVFYSWLDIGTKGQRA